MMARVDGVTARLRFRDLAITVSLECAPLARTALLLAPILLSSVDATAQESADGSREASQHFRHGVELYNEADYSAALVEFKRAYALAPTAAALYNVGETQYELQDYAGALKTFRRFLAESAANDAHRPEVENNIQVLRSRVGHLRIVTVPPGADVALDDQEVGKTPLDEPLLVSVGRRKVTASMAGRPPLTRYQEVAAGDDVTVTLSLSPTVDTGTPRASAEAPPPPSALATPARSASSLRPVAWIAAGALGAGAAAFGVLAINEANDLKKARRGLTTAAVLSHEANLTTTYSVIADSLAAAAIVLGGVSLYWSLSSPSGSERGGAPVAGITLTPASAHFDIAF
jgi:tetratricopeptide (TPR) repeat protein